ncbi:MAG: hypothetical protein D6675_02530 [Gemmatimonadetes bacterium]|nr:MAG: hypothetical protein D6675_02530 [Gemmatimonadota bacterium]
MKKIAAIFWKDIITEFRTKESVSSMLVFGLLVIVIFNFAFEDSRAQATKIAPGVLWVAFTFAGILGLNRSFAVEKDQNCIQGLMLAPVDRGAIYAGKMLANCVFMFLVECIILPFFILFFNLNLINQLPLLFLVNILGTVGFVAVGTIFAAVSANSRMQEVMLPILLFPVAVPMLLAAVESTILIFQGGSFTSISNWVKLLAGFDIVFTVVSFMIFDFVLEE